MIESEGMSGRCRVLFVRLGLEYGLFTGVWYVFFSGRGWERFGME